METRLFHIFRNTPKGRETLLQSAYFCLHVGAALVVYIPQHPQFLMYFENDVVQIDLDPSYRTSPATAVRRVEDLIRPMGVEPTFFTPRHFTSAVLPDIPTHFDYLCCPETLEPLSFSIGFGYVGSRIRRLMRSARFPVLLPAPAFKPWSRITVFFDGSENGLNALRMGLRVRRASGKPLDLFTHADGHRREAWERMIRESLGGTEAETAITHWRWVEHGGMEEALWEIPHDAVGVLGAWGQGVFRDGIAGRRMDALRKILPNPLLLVGGGSIPGDGPFRVTGP